MPHLIHNCQTLATLLIGIHVLSLWASGNTVTFQNIIFWNAVMLYSLLAISDLHTVPSKETLSILMKIRLHTHKITTVYHNQSNWNA